MKVIVAMSGGVDSSVAAYLLKKQGHDVIGLSFELWDRRDLDSTGQCCSLETIELAKSVAHSLGIEHYTADVRDAFYHHVIEEFCESYIQGMTPNPCILCNKYIKFDFLLKKADELNAEMVATGHYARIGKSQESGVWGLGEEQIEQNNRQKTTDTDSYVLKKGVDPKKDQSYVLYVMKQEELRRTLFPLGEMNKEQTRQIAADLGLSSALRAESQEICFVGDDRYRDFVRDFSPEALNPGPILDPSGNVLGEHRGIAFYTIGQRKGLGIASSKPLYVSAINRIKNTLLVGPREHAMRKTIRVRMTNHLISRGLFNNLQRVHVKIRSTMKEVPASVHPEGQDTTGVTFDSPQWAPAPGQSAVFYDNDIVLGGGIIE